MSDAILDPFHRALKFAIDEQVATLLERLAAGSAKANDYSSVAENYAAQCARIETFKDVLSLCALIEKNMLDVGMRPANVKVVER